MVGGGTVGEKRVYVRIIGKVSAKYNLAFRHSRSSTNIQVLQGRGKEMQILSAKSLKSKKMFWYGPPAFNIPANGVPSYHYPESSKYCMGVISNCKGGAR